MCPLKLVESLKPNCCVFVILFGDLRFNNVWLAAEEQPSFDPFPRSAAALNCIVCLQFFLYNLGRQTEESTKRILLSNWSMGKLILYIYPLH